MAPDSSAPAYAYLAALGIEYQRFDHEPVFTCDEAEKAVPAGLGAAHTKNLFLRDGKGRRHWLLVTLCAKQVDLRAFGERVVGERVSFASAERLAKYLGVTPGSVTILGLMNDGERAVELLVDDEVWAMDRWQAHPLVNTATLVMARSDIERFLDATGHQPRVVSVPARSPAP
jgi:Ala-tRNA(Pro) deacylase